MDASYLLGTRALTYLVTYLLNYTVARGYKTGNTSETVEDRAKLLTPYVKSYGLSIAAKMYDLEWPLREIQGHLFLKYS